MPGMNFKHKPLLLIVLDGWGHSDNPDHNAIAAANTPTWDRIWQQYPHTLLSASGEDVGLPAGQMGNSEVGHLHMGAGRLVPQDLLRINNAVADKSFFTNPTLTSAIDTLIKQNKALHILGLLSPGGVHSHEDHILAVVELATQRGLKNIYIHALLDGRDTPPQSAQASLDKLQAKINDLKCGQIASIIGRYYAMDRDKRWDRCQQAYDVLTSGEAEYHAINAAAALEMAYNRGESDEFVKPTAIHPEHQPAITVQDGDGIIFMNFRADRARQLTLAFTDPDFQGFTRHQQPKLSCFVTLTQYSAEMRADVAFPTIDVKNTFGEYIAEQGYQQLRIAETEKYAHVTYFFNGGNEDTFPHENRILVPSPKVSTYDLKPQMSSSELTNQLIEAIKSERYDAIICNYAPPDMVGHTGNYEATIQAIENIDQCLQQIIQVQQQMGGEILITADHGNAEHMFDPQTGQPHTAHTTEPVPLIYIGREAEIEHQGGTLQDIAPTMLYLMGLQPPEDMTGKSLIQLPVTA